MSDQIAIASECQRREAQKFPPAHPPHAPLTRTMGLSQQVKDAIVAAREAVVKHAETHKLIPPMAGGTIHLRKALADYGLEGEHTVAVQELAERAGRNAKARKTPAVKAAKCVARPPRVLRAAGAQPARAPRRMWARGCAALGLGPSGINMPMTVTCETPSPAFFHP